MHSFSAALIATLFFSPFPVLSTTYYSDHVVDYSKPTNHHLTHYGDQSLPMTATIAIDIDIHLKDSAKFSKCSDTSKPCHPVPQRNLGFKCGEKFVDHYKTMKSANECCDYIRASPGIGNLPYHQYPTSYQIQGPYVEWPIKISKKYRKKHNYYVPKLVMTERCEVVAAVMYENENKFEPCSYQPL